MIQTSPRAALGYYLPAPPDYLSALDRRGKQAAIEQAFAVRTLSGLAAPPLPGDWASRNRHQYGWPVLSGDGSQAPARPHEIRNRSPWVYVPYGGMYGLGNLYGLGQTQAQVVQQVGAIAGTTIPAIPGVASSVASIIGVTTSAAIPIIGAAIAAVTIGIAMILNSGCGQTCIITSNWANQAEGLLRQNLNAYFNLAKPRAQSAQAVALANFDAVWNKLATECSSPQVGNAGVRCISDRQAGACTWKQTANYGPDITAAGEPAIGACWNWFSGYRDPIQNDPNTAPDAQSAQAGLLQQGGTTPVSSTAIQGPGGTVTSTVDQSGTQTSGSSLASKNLIFLGLAALGIYFMSQSGGGR